MKSNILGLLSAVGLAAALGGASRHRTGRQGFRRRSRRRGQGRGRPGARRAVRPSVHAPAPPPAPAAPPSSGTRRATGGTAEPLDVARRAGEGLRQPLLPRRDRILGVGGDDLGRHHPDRRDLRLLGRGRSRQRHEEDRTRSGDHQVRHREPRSSRSRRRRAAAAGALRRARGHVRRGLGTGREHGRVVAEADAATWWRPTVSG